MKIENTGIENLTIDFSDLTEIMSDNGFFLTTQWDYDRVTFEQKLENKDDTFCLRVQGNAIEGDVGGRYAVIKLVTPFIGKHFHLYDIEYGDDVDFPNSIIDQSKNILSKLKESIEAIQQAS